MGDQVHVVLRFSGAVNLKGGKREAYEEYKRLNARN